MFHEIEHGEQRRICVFEYHNRDSLKDGNYNQEKHMEWTDNRFSAYYKGEEDENIDNERHEGTCNLGHD